MKSLFAALLLLVLLVGSAYAGLSYETENVPGSNLQNDWENGDDLWWGLSVYLNVTPEWDDLLSDNGTNNNNTDYRWSFTSFPGVLAFSPSSVTFRVTIEEGADTIDGAEDVTFTPAWQLVRFWPVNMNASLEDPIWSFNLTDGLVVPQHPDLGADVSLSWTQECFSGANPCVDIESVINQNETDFVRPKLRKWIYLLFL